MRPTPSRTRVLTDAELKKRRWKAAGAVVLAVLAAVVIVGGLKLASIARQLPSIDNLADSRSHRLTTIVSSDGVLLATFETHYRRPVALDQISPKLIDATLATEDARFYSHSAVDLRGIARAIVHNLGKKNLVGQGGSTITQQLARNLYLTNQKTARRKVEEILLADRIEKRYSKHDILEAYLNTIYYGNGCYGVEAASRAYFHKPASQLELGEAALLAGLPQRPAAYSPLSNPKEALDRRSEVLNRMIAVRKITPDEAKQAESKPVHVYRPRPQSQTNWKAPYFVAHVISKLRENLGSESIFSGMQVVTTLNWKMQKAAEEALRDGLRSGQGPNTGAIISLDPRTGAVRALVGGADFKRDQFDAATQGIRQPGSSFKPIVYGAAFEAGAINLASTIVDKPLVYPSTPRPWIVHNFDGRYRGTISILDAIRQSINTAAVQVAEQTGTDMVQAFGQQLGITTPMSHDLPLALGASGVHPIDLCSAYSAFANRGARCDPYTVQQIVDAEDKEVYRDNPAGRQHSSFMNAMTVDQINVALREVVLHGTGTAASSIPDAHGKTGTTSSGRDAWFAGYTANLATVIWMAHVEKHSAKTGRTIVRYLPMPGATGGRLCAPLWARFMKAAIPAQARVDKVHGVPAVVIQQPDTETMIAQLKGTPRDESAIDVRAAGQDGAGFVVAEPDMSEEQVPTYFHGDDSQPVTRVVPADSPSTSSDEAETRHDMEEGYRELERRKDGLP